MTRDILRSKLPPQLQRVTSLVPPSDRKAAAKAVDDLEALVYSHFPSYDQLYNLQSFDCYTDKRVSVPRTTLYAITWEEA
jgi:hypothetical protein